jgi:UDP-N-acetyl-D-glucosamine dehydrogenase
MNNNTSRSPLSPPAAPRDIIGRIRQKKVLIGVMGLGYVGLPLCREFSSQSCKTLGFDIDPAKIEKLAKGKTYIDHIPDSEIRKMNDGGYFSATTDFSRLDEPDVILIAVPTPLDKMRQPDLKYVVSSCRAIAAKLRKGQLVVLESTTYPGTTREVMLPILEENSGLKAGTDFFLAYSPEREDPGRSNYTTRTIPKIVGGYDQDSLKVAVEAYKLAIDNPVPVSSCEAAEASKILENTYRSINIALVNELKMLFDRMGIDIWEVINAASTKPFGFKAFYPGPGLGGHCIPIDPFYLSWKAKEYEIPTRFIELAGEINCAMPEWVISKLTDALNSQTKSVKGSRILIIGLAYKPDVDDDRESPTYKLMDLLEKKGAQVDYHDPHIPEIPVTREYSSYAGIKSVDLTGPGIGSYDCVLISTNHRSVDYDFVVKNAALVVDTRNATKGISDPGEKIVKA